MRASTAWARAAMVLIAVVAIDQLSKRAVIASIDTGDTRNVLPGLQLTHTHNHGVAFGVLPGNDGVVVAIIAAALLAVLVYFMRHTSRPFVWLPTGLLIGGALGNISDRVRDGSVTDWIKLPLGWPPFNLADVSITLGVLTLLYVIEEGSPGDQGDQPAGKRRLPASAPGRPE